MKETSKQLIKEYSLKKLKCDFMGYKFKRVKNLTFHHLIVSHQNCKLLQIPNEGYVMWNGVMLDRETSHDYLHIIEDRDEEIFCKITSELIDEKIKREITKENLIAIRNLLLQFEAEHANDTNSKGAPLIKRKFITGRIPLE